MAIKNIFGKRALLSLIPFLFLFGGPCNAAIIGALHCRASYFDTPEARYSAEDLRADSEIGLDFGQVAMDGKRFAASIEMRTGNFHLTLMDKATSEKLVIRDSSGSASTAIRAKFTKNPADAEVFCYFIREI